jgi:hypothetical protein
MRWLMYWALCLATTIGVVLNVLEEQGHTLGGVILAVAGIVAVFGFIGIMAQSAWEDINE